VTLKELKVIIDKFYENGHGSHEVVFGSRLQRATDVDHILVIDTVHGLEPIKEEDVDFDDEVENVIAIG